jgi:UDP-glucose 4-epimerase
VNHWLSGQTPTCSTPAYIRDNIHGSLLARSYAHFCAHVSSNSTTLHLAPSGYVESQGDFARRVARELEPRLGVPCPIEFQNQLGFDEPKVRINLDPLDPNLLGWNEEKAWDEMAHYYLSMRREP